VTTSQYPWYSKVYGKKLEQGDILKECPFLQILNVPTKINDQWPSKAKLLTSIILSQSCDLENSKIETVVVCPITSLPIWLEELLDAGAGRSKKEKEFKRLKNGLYIGNHLINRINIPKHEEPPLVVDFRRLTTIPFDIATELAEKQSPRIRLNPPYREHLSQQFARFFMRVGLPSDIQFD